MMAWPKGTVATLKWFYSQGGYQQLIDSYRKAPWVTRIGSGAYVQYGDQVSLPGGVYALQSQLGLPVHIGGKTALELFGAGHNIQLGNTAAFYLFASGRTRLPAWFTNHSWEDELRYKVMNLFKSDPDAGLIEFDMASFSVKGAGPERAIIEMCALTPDIHSFEETGHFMESLLALRVETVQYLMEICGSKKAKRLFLYFADQNNMPWFHKLNIKAIDLGKGRRALAANGVFNKDYLITVPAKNQAVRLEDIPPQDVMSRHTLPKTAPSM